MTHANSDQAVIADKHQSTAPKETDPTANVWHPSVAQETSEILKALRSRDSDTATRVFDQATANGNLNKVEDAVSAAVDKTNGKKTNYNFEQTGTNYNDLPGLPNLFSYSQYKDAQGHSYQYYYQRGSAGNGGQEYGRDKPWIPMHMF